MAKQEVHVSDVGTVFRVTLTDSGVPVDLSTASVLQLVFGKPRGNPSVTKTAVLTTDGTDGKLEYTTVSGDLDIDGLWKIQAHIVIPTLGEWRSEVGEFLVFQNL